MIILHFCLYGNIKNIDVVIIFIVCAFHFFILIISLVFYMLLMVDPFNDRCCVLEDERGRKFIFVELNFLYSVLLYV